MGWGSEMASGRVPREAWPNTGLAWGQIFPLEPCAFMVGACLEGGAWPGEEAGVGEPAAARACYYMVKWKRGTET